MKKQIAKILRKVAEKMSPNIEQKPTAFPPIKIDRYEGKRLACGYRISEKDMFSIYAQEKHSDPFLADRKEIESVYITALKDKIKQGIFMAIEKYDLIEYSIDDYGVSGHLYVSEKEGKCLE